jgi:N-acetylmuramoyl-L-alanine amidase
MLLLSYAFPAWSASEGAKYRIPTRTIEGRDYVSIQDLAVPLSARIETVPLKDKVILNRPKDRDLVFTILSSVYLVGQVQFRAPDPARIVNGDLYVSSDVAEKLGFATKPSTNGDATPSVSSTAPPIIKPHEPPSESELQERWAIDRVVIDPGHGGKDPGAVGPRGTREKDITLSVAKRLGAMLKQLGIEVVHTRTADTFIKNGRTRIARESKADLFVSLHCNAGKRRAAGGIEVYFLSEAKTDAAAKAAERENAAFELESDGAEDDGSENALRGMKARALSDQYLIESQDLAANIRSAMARRFKNMDDRGVKQANFYVMRGTMGAMPSVLVEMGFISNPKEEKRLKTASFQKSMANAIFEGIRSFKIIHEKQLPNTR